MIKLNKPLFHIAVFTLAALGSLFLTTLEAQAQTCTFTIKKEAIPSDGTEFDFTCIGGFSGNCNNNSNFSLMDGEEQFIITSTSPNFSQTVTEDVPDGWVLNDISCEITSGDPNGITFDFDTVENGVIIDCLIIFTEATCTFSNVRACDVTIGKTAIPDDGTIFDFNAPGSTDPEFSLTNGEEMDIQIIAGEDVDVTETLPLGWRLNDVECSNTDGVVISNIDNGVNLACGSGGGSVECIFANTNIRNIPTMSEWGLIILAVILGISGVLYFQKMRRMPSQ